MTRLLPQERTPASAKPAAPPVPPARDRLDSVDLLRGLVMVVMALDHVKGHLTNATFDLTDLTKTTPAYFLTRWVSHFCAPTFVFLAGTGAFLYGARGRSTKSLAWFLLSRGLWLIVLELTVIRFAWFLNVGYAFSFGQVIWVIGLSMVLLSALVFLPTSFVTAFGVLVIAFHNLFDAVRAEDWGRYGWLWKVLHTGETFEFAPGRTFAPFYPLVPWVGVLAAGYGFGALFLIEPRRRRRELLGLGAALTLGFVALRYANLYGDKAAPGEGFPGPWSPRESPLFTFFSFVNCQKYPPSLLFLLMTLGPAIMSLSLFEHLRGPVARFFVVFGRVPLFFYLLHWYLIKGLTLAAAHARHGRADWFFGDPPGTPPPQGYGYDLWVVYLVWAGVVLALFPPCWWFARVKQRTRSPWLSYL